MNETTSNAAKPAQPDCRVGLPDRFVITVGRQMGSGGRLLGRMIADRLGIDFYDKELLLDAAKRSGLNPDFFERNDERRPHFISGLFSFSLGVNPFSGYAGSTSISDDALYKAQCDFIHEIAGRGPCVIVGRSADYVLRDLPNVVNLFVHADPDDCAERIATRNPEMNHEQAGRFAEKTNKLRANFYNFYTDKRWGDAAGYDLCLSTSRLSLEAITDLVVEYLHQRFNPNHTNK